MSKVIAITQVLFNPFLSKSSKAVSVSGLRNTSGTKAWLYLLAFLNLFLFFSYVVGVNSNASQGYEIKKLQTQIASFSEQNKKLNLKISEISSIATIQNDLASQNFAPAGNAKFLEIKQYSLK